LVLGGTYDPSANHREKMRTGDARFARTAASTSAGVVLGPLSGEIENESLEGLAIQPDGKILATGTKYPATAELRGGARCIADFGAEAREGQTQARWTTGHEHEEGAARGSAL
jgi:hypothetical protein